MPARTDAWSHARGAVVPAGIGPLPRGARGFEGRLYSGRKAHPGA